MLLEEGRQVRLQLGSLLHAPRPHLEPDGVLDKRRDLAEGLEVAVVKNGDAIADILHVFQPVRAHQHRLALLAEIEDEVLHPARAEGVEAGGGFVEDDEFGVVDERLGQTDALPHALRVLLQDALLSAESPTMSMSSAARLANIGIDGEEPAVEVQGLLGVEEAVEYDSSGR